MTVDDFLKKMVTAGRGQGFKLFLTVEKPRAEIVWKDFVSVEMGGKTYKSSATTMTGRLNEVLWRVRHNEPN